MKIWQRIKAAIHKATAPENTVTIRIERIDAMDMKEFREALAREFEIAAQSGPEHLS